MVSGDDQTRRARTVLEARIWARQMTFEEFAEYAETFARENGHAGTLSLRHLHRLAAGKATGVPLPATRRLLEALFGIPCALLLGRPDVSAAGEDHDEAGRLSLRMRTAARVDPELVELLGEQVDVIRKLDRRIGAATLLTQLRQHAAHVSELLTYAVNPEIRRGLATVLADANTLAGWQSLDLGESVAAWRHYRDACEAARAAESPTLLAHTQAEQAVVLSDAGETARATELTAHACESARQSAPALLRAWLAAAHGETLAANGEQAASLHAFDAATAQLPAHPEPEPGMLYVALNDAHLARWRGHALACFGHPDAVDVLTTALTRHDPSFVRAEAGLRTDLALAHSVRAEQDQAVEYRDKAEDLAQAVGSARHLRRLYQIIGR